MVPICAATAACGLFEKDQLALPYPTLEPKKLGKTLLIWSGASSVGCNAIQLAVAAGCEVVTTCSPKNNELMRKLGASAAFDYASETVVEDIVKYLEGKTIAGAMASKLFLKCHFICIMRILMELKLVISTSARDFTT